jgi:uncharacterized membrane protein
MYQRLQWAISSRIPNRRRLALLGKISLSVSVLWAFKRLAHDLGLDVLRINPLFIALLAAVLILLSLLLNGVLSDYKESEKLPAEAATALEILSLEIAAIPAHNPQAQITEHQLSALKLGEALLAWILSKTPTPQIHIAFQECYRDMVAATALLHGKSSLQARPMQQMEAILRIINRIDTIRTKGFVPSVYWLAYLGTGMLCIFLVLTRLDPPLEAGLFLLVISFVLLFLIHLIGDLDNPFGYDDPDSTEDVSLDILIQTLQRLRNATQSDR